MRVLGALSNVRPLCQLWLALIGRHVAARPCPPGGRALLLGQRALCQRANRPSMGMVLHPGVPERLLLLSPLGRTCAREAEWLLLLPVGKA